MTLSTHKVILALGANVDATANMARMQQLLRGLYPSVRFTPSLTSAAVGIVAPPFTNSLAVLLTTDDYGTLNQRLKGIESQLGSVRADRRAGHIVADVDVLSYDGIRYHTSDWERDYIRRLLPLLPPLSAAP